MEFINERGTCFFLDLFLFMRTTFFQESVSAICLDLEIESLGETKLKSPFSLHDDISKIGTRPEVNQSAFQRGKFDASKDRLLVNRKSLCSEL